MAKIITAKELSEIITGLLVNPEGAGCLDEASIYGKFLQDIAYVVTEYCGGDVGSFSQPHPEACLEGEL